MKRIWPKLIYNGCYTIKPNQPKSHIFDINV